MLFLLGKRVGLSTLLPLAGSLQESGCTTVQWFTVYGNIE